MTIPSLGKLESVDLRDAWPHEAHSFTPWMAENLDGLSEVIGIPLELEGREVAVDRFSADILARCPMDDSLVLIENQLEPTDHTHLGQVLTYLAGLEAQIVVWVAQQFYDPHLSAIRWLNEHTVDPFAFFAVRVKVVRIGDSQLAPVFEVLERPNEWDRRLQTIARETREISEVGRFRRAFWEHYRERHPDDFDVDPGYAASSAWFTTPIDGIYVVIYIGQKEVGLFLRGERSAAADDVYERLTRVNPITWINFGVSPSENAKGHFCGKSLEIDSLDETNWNRMADWLYDQRHEFQNALKGQG